MLRYLGKYACLDTTQLRKVNRMKWNSIPFDERATPEVKALEFDLQIEENAREAAIPKLTVDQEVQALNARDGQS